MRSNIIEGQFYEILLEHPQNSSFDLLIELSQISISPVPKARFKIEYLNNDKYILGFPGFQMLSFVIHRK